eukprot:CAMPEP_0116060254 /NCGR_PEP_ID=MMETSP0322-20121206/6301_1 /TAXON_ID=163516 /ORGANISM="Leptocylindrus danicus var. apora, Strain B651" /LENGTH=831 /DNA_ID=CAMNT_0003544829 /DNA_START=86 /DNA_END=2582 /DNA_ORIENTATION=+
MAAYILLGRSILTSAFTSTSTRTQTSKFGNRLRHVYSAAPTDVKSSSSNSKLADLFKNRGDKVAPRLRFAPSPTGSLHVGGARTALYNWLLAQQAKLEPSNQGAVLQPGFVLRVEDTDQARSTKESEESVLADLKWLGLIWEEGPDSETNIGPYRQSERMLTGLYQELADYLISEGKAYKCFLTNEELDAMKAAQEVDGSNVRTESPWREASEEDVQKAIDEGKEYTIRFKVPANSRVVINDAVRGTVSWDAEKTVGDFVLLRSNGMPVYNYCVAVDDANMGITTVIRAEEHLTNTVRQVLILDALGATRPTYAHCSLILGQDKQKLSKRHGATSCTQFKEDGFLPDAMINYLSLLGWNDGTDNEIFTRDELIEAFELDRVVKSPAVFDEDKLRWINAQHLKRLEMSEVVTYVQEALSSRHSGAGDDLKLAELITILARQFMDTTVAPVENMEKVLGYGLTSFDNLSEDAKEMVSKGYFYNVAKGLIESFEKNELPLPNAQTIDRLFYDKDSVPIIEDSESSNAGAYDFAEAYKVHMKQFSKDLAKVSKARNFSILLLRLALTGEMSGQDVTKQLALVEYITSKNIEVNCDVVPMNSRIETLKSFIETIPEDLRAPPKEEPKQAKKESEKSVQSAPVELVVAAPTDPLESYEGPSVAALDIRVGEVKECKNHEEADRLLCEVVDVGEVDEDGNPKYRNIASGLREYYNPEDIVGRKVLVLCNLKARKLVGFPSHGMLLCASSKEENGEKSNVQLISVPSDAKIGERITIPDVNFEEEGMPMAENKIGKKKILEKLLPSLKTSKYGVPEFCERPFMTSAGVCTTSINDGTVG